MGEGPTHVDRDLFPDGVLDNDLLGSPHTHGLKRNISTSNFDQRLGLFEEQFACTRLRMSQ